MSGLFLARYLLLAALFVLVLALFWTWLRRVCWLVLLAALTGLAWTFRDGLAGWALRLGILRSDVRVLSVGGADGAYLSIAEALAAARAGQVVEVAPGTYDERVELRDGVALVSSELRGAVLRLTPRGLDEPVAVLADGVEGARLEGFRIVGGEGRPLAVGLRLVDAAVVVEEVEVSGAGKAAVEILGRDRSLLAYCVLRGNGGPGVVLNGPAASRLRHNLIQDNGGANNSFSGGDHLAQSLWTLATGGLTGTGLGLGQPSFVPAVHTDMVIAALGEELGFAGLLAIFALYGLLIWRGLNVAACAAGIYSYFLTLGFSLVLALQLFLIAGGVFGLLPLSGVVTPFLSRA